LADPRVEVVNADGFAFATRDADRYDVIVLDLPDPRTEVLARLYSREFYARLHRRLNPDGVLVTQAGSPYYTRESYWTIVATLRAVGLVTHPYRVNVPAFGEWGFVAASSQPRDWGALHLPLPRRFLTEPLLMQAAHFDPDTAPVTDARPSTLEQPVVWRQYRQRVRYWRD
jgi:spermidine synthase